MTQLNPETAAALQRLTSLHAAAAPDPLELLRAIRSVQNALETDAATLTSVRAAVAAGCSWHDVGVAAGLKAAAARWRWLGTDEDIAARVAAGRKRSARPSSVPTDLPGLSVAEAAARLGVTASAVYLQISRGTLDSREVTVADGRSYKRVFPSD